MPISLDSIFKPVGDFFINRFQTDPANPVFFRFRKFASVIAEKDYADPDNPGFTFMAQERFSDLTNSLPGEDPDGMSVYFGADLIDSRYQTLLRASSPVANQGPNGQAIMSVFNAIKHDAQQDWEAYTLARGIVPVPDTYRLSFASPSNWYESNNSQIWTTQSFEITETVTEPAVDLNFQLWRFALDSYKLNQILPSLGSEAPIPPTALVVDLINAKPQFSSLLSHNAPVTPAINLLTNDDELPDEEVEEVATEEEVFEDQPRLRKGLKLLNLLQRAAVLDYIRENSPTQSSSTTKLKINFEYCTVNIRRPWFIDAFIRNKSWFIHGAAKGSRSAPGPEMNLSALPIELIAIRNLSIEANWSQVDVDASRNATNFVPFEIRTKIENNRMSHDGIQIIGYMLQRMPALPPNDPPQ